MSKYVVTGGAGFIGSALVRGLLRDGASKIVVIDNLLTGREANLDEVRQSVELHNADIRDYNAIAPILRGADVVFHEAAIPSVPRSIEDPVPSHEVNIDGTFQVLRAAVAGKARRVVYAASSSAYGDTEVLPKVETMNPRPKSPYALQKLAGEYLPDFPSALELKPSHCAISTYSDRARTLQSLFGVLSLFMRAILEKRPPRIYGDGEQSRDFTYVDDVVA
jgi:UDP-glucose 4-epimerase